MLAKALMGASAIVAPSSGITFVGYTMQALSANPATLSLTSLTGGIASAPAAGDIVFAVRVFKSITNQTITCNTAGYTQVADLYSNSTNDSQMGVFYKVLSTAETSVELANSTITTLNGITAAFVWRNVNQSTPLDVTSTTAVSTTAQPNCPSITTATSNAVVFILGAGAGSNLAGLTDLTAPSGMENFYQLMTNQNSGDNQNVLGMASILRPSAGAYDPPAFGGGSTSAFNSYCAVTIALRQA